MALNGEALGGAAPRGRPALHVVVMAAALVIAAFLGAAVGLVWQSAGFGDEGAAGEDAGSEAGEPAPSSAEASA